MKEDRDQLYLHHIMDAIIKVKIYIKDKSFSDFERDQMFYDAVIREITVIGEAANNLSENFREKHSDWKLHRAIGMRNQLVHGYFDTRPAIVWQTAKEDLPKLEEQVKKLI